MGEWIWQKTIGNDGTVLLSGRLGNIGVTVETTDGGWLFGGCVIVDGGEDIVECAGERWGIGLEEDDAQAKAEAIAMRDAYVWLAHARNEGVCVDAAPGREEEGS